MKKIMVLLLIFISACDSPRNHQIEPSSGLQKNQNELILKNLEARFFPYWAEGPFGNVQKTSVLILYVHNQNKQLIDLPSDQNLTFFATMPSMGHPLDQPGEFIRIAKGIYLNNSIRFNMAGDWQMEVSVINSKDEVVEQASWQEFF